MVSRTHILMLTWLTVRNLVPWVFLIVCMGVPPNLFKTMGYGNYANVCRCCSGLSIYICNIPYSVLRIISVQMMYCMVQRIKDLHKYVYITTKQAGQLRQWKRHNKTILLAISSIFDLCFIIKNHAWAVCGETTTYFMWFIIGSEISLSVIWYIAR